MGKLRISVYTYPHHVQYCHKSMQRRIFKLLKLCCFFQKIPKLSFSVRSITLPLLACFNVLGLSTAEFRNTTFCKLQRIYCFIIAVLCFVLSIVSLVLKMCNIKTSFISVMYLVSTIVTTATLTYYRINFTRAESVTRKCIF